MRLVPLRSCSILAPRNVSITVALRCIPNITRLMSRSCMVLSMPVTVLMSNRSMGVMAVSAPDAASRDSFREFCPMFFDAVVLSLRT